MKLCGVRLINENIIILLITKYITANTQAKERGELMLVELFAGGNFNRRGGVTGEGQFKE